MNRTEPPFIKNRETAPICPSPRHQSGSFGYENNCSPLPAASEFFSYRTLGNHCGYCDSCRNSAAGFEQSAQQSAWNQLRFQYPPADNGRIQLYGRFRGLAPLQRKRHPPGQLQCWRCDRQRHDQGSRFSAVCRLHKKRLFRSLSLPHCLSSRSCQAYQK